MNELYPIPRVIYYLDQNGLRYPNQIDLIKFGSSSQVLKTSSSKSEKLNEKSLGDKIIKFDSKLSMISEINLPVFSKLMQNSKV